MERSGDWFHYPPSNREEVIKQARVGAESLNRVLPLYHGEGYKRLKQIMDRMLSDGVVIRSC